MILDQVREHVAGDLAAVADRASVNTAWELWETALRGSVPAGDFALEGLENDQQLGLDSKSALMVECLLTYGPSAERLNQANDESTPCPLTALERACRRFPSRGRGATLPSGAAELSRVLPFPALERLLPRKGANAFYRSESGRSWKSRLSGAVLRDLAVMRQLQGLIQSRDSPHVFMTTSDWVDDLERTGDDLAGKVRDTLGLPHFDLREMCEVRVREETARASGSFLVPTFADAGGYPPFLPSTPTAEFGIARNLTDSTVVGGPEVWVGDMNASDASGLRFIGIPESSITAQPWKDFAAWIRSRR